MVLVGSIPFTPTHLQKSDGLPSCPAIKANHRHHQETDMSPLLLGIPFTFTVDLMEPLEYLTFGGLTFPA